MTTPRERVTIYLAPEVREWLRLKAATSRKRMSAIVERILDAARKRERP